MECGRPVPSKHGARAKFNIAVNKGVTDRHHANEADITFLYAPFRINRFQSGLLHKRDGSRTLATRALLRGTNACFRHQATGQPDHRPDNLGNQSVLVKPLRINRSVVARHLNL